MKARTGGENGSLSCPLLAQNIAGGKTSYELSLRFFFFFLAAGLPAYLTSPAAYSSVVMASLWIFNIMWALMRRHPTSPDGVTAPGPTHPAALGVIGERSIAAIQLGEPGVWNPSPGDAFLASHCGGGP